MTQIDTSAAASAPEQASLPPASRAIEAVICIPTFRRPHMLRDTLASLKGQCTTRRFALAIVDNDAAGREGMAEAQAFLSATGMAGIVLTEPQQGNCHAINAVFAAARSAFPEALYDLMIDDDEIASPYWLERMIISAEHNSADIVGGPVLPVFDSAAPLHARNHPVFAPPFMETGAVPMIYGSGNFLIRREALKALGETGFDLRFNFLGGGDTDFFTRCRRAGLTFAWDADALISETVPPARTTPRWIIQRGLRIGAINYAIEAKFVGSPLGTVKVWAKSAIICALALPRGLMRLVRTRSLLAGIHPALIALGRVLSGIGIEPQQYKAKVGS